MGVRRSLKKKSPDGDSGSGEKWPGGDWTWRRLQLVGEDISCLIHEVRTPLTAVIAAAELLRRPCSSAEHEFFLAIIENESRRIDALLGDFFEAYHRDAGTWLADMNLSPLSVADLVEGAVSRFCNLDQKYHLQMSIATDLPPVRVDREKMNLVLRNLLANAVKYSPGGGTIRVSAEKKAKCVIIHVHDEGIGISEENLPRIFESAFRGAPPSGMTIRGAGLGLAIVQRIVESHGGAVRVVSRPAAGSTFSLSLPIDAAATATRRRRGE